MSDCQVRGGSSDSMATNVIARPLCGDNRRVARAKRVKLNPRRSRRNIMMPRTRRAPGEGPMGPASRLLDRQPDLDLPVEHPNRIGRDVDHGWQGQRLPGLQIEARPMSWTLDLCPFDFTFGDRTVVVRAHVGDGEVAPGDVEDGDDFAVDI